MLSRRILFLLRSNTTFQRSHFLPRLICTTSTTRLSSLLTRDSTKALSWTQIFDRAPVSVGILDLWGSFHDVIGVNDALPIQKMRKFESLVNHVTSTSFTLCQKSLLRPAIPITDLKLDGLRSGKRGLSKVVITVSLERALSGTLEACETYTKSTSSTSFGSLSIPTYDKDIATKS